MRTGRGVVAAAVLLALAAALAWRSVVDIDVGLHLAGGRFVAEHGQVPRLDPFTWTVGDHAYVAYHWAFQLAVHASERAAGVTGVVALRFALLLGAALLLLDVLRVRRVSAAAGSAVALLALFASEWRFTLRPELVSWLLVAATLAVLERHRQGRPAPLFALPLLQIVWANTHVHVFGLGIQALYAADDALRRRSARTPLLGWLGASVVATLANPYGLRGALYPLELWARFSGDDPFARHIAELVSPMAIAADPDAPFSTSAQLAAVRVLLVASAVAAPWHLVRRRFLDAAVLVVFGALAALAVRNAALFAVAALAPLAVALDDGFGSQRTDVSPARRRVADILLIAALAVALLQIPRIASGTFYAGMRRHDRFSAEWCRPCLALDTADWIAAAPLEGRGLNNLTLGSVLVWRDPTRRVFIDGRNEVTGPDFFERYLRALDPVRWEETWRAFDLDYVALAHRADPRVAPLVRRLLDARDWKLVHLDGAGVVFVRRSGRSGALPAVSLPAPVAPARRLAVLEAIDVQTAPAARLRRWLWSRQRPPGDHHGLGNLLARVGRPAAAERPLLEAARAHPQFFEVHLDLGLVYRTLGLPAPSLLELRRAFRLAPDHPELRVLGRAPAAAGAR